VGLLHFDSCFIVTVLSKNGHQHDTPTPHTSTQLKQKNGDSQILNPLALFIARLARDNFLANLSDELMKSYET
jgi:hypothetical protein